jgi:hypothetical protein
MDCSHHTEERGTTEATSVTGQGGGGAEGSGGADTDVLLQLLLTAVDGGEKEAGSEAARQ